jgi:hypothetical protein
MPERPRKSIEVLPTPSEDLFKQLQIEYLTNRDALVADFFQRLQQENPQLVTPVTAKCFASPEPETTLMWTSVYYLLYSRSATKQGVKMLEVSEGVFNAYYQQEGDEARRAMPVEDELANFFEERDKNYETLKRTELSRSEELGAFWVEVHMMTLDRFAASHGNPREISRLESIMGAVRDIQALLFTQEEVNNLGAKFSED